jgi:hypothetical protein
MVLLNCLCTNQASKSVISGTAEVMAPTQKVRRESAPLPELKLTRHEGFNRLMALTAALPAVDCAVVFPTLFGSLRTAVVAAQSDLMRPWLIGPRGAAVGHPDAEHQPELVHRRRRVVQGLRTPEG